MQSLLESTGGTGLRVPLVLVFCPGDPLLPCDWEVGGVTPWVEVTATVAGVLVLSHTSGARPKSDAS